MSALETAVAERAAGEQVSRPKALVAATFAGFLTATLTYRVLRSGSQQQKG
jgi:hypothetical protein